MRTLLGHQHTAAGTGQNTLFEPGRAVNHVKGSCGAGKNTFPEISDKIAIAKFGRKRLSIPEINQKGYIIGF